MTIAPRLAFASSAFLGQLLQTQIERGHDGVSRNRWRDDPLGGLPPILVESQFVFAVLTGEHGVERLLEPIAAFCFRPEHFVIVDHSIRIPSGLAAIADDVASRLAVRISADVDRTQASSPPATFP